MMVLGTMPCTRGTFQGDPVPGFVVPVFGVIFGGCSWQEPAGRAQELADLENPWRKISEFQDEFRGDWKACKTY